MARDSQLDQAPWGPIEDALDAYEPRARRVRNVAYLASLLGVAGGVALFVAPEPVVRLFGGGAAPFALVLGLLFVPRVLFALWNAQAAPRCPGCRASLGWDLRGSPKPVLALRRESACPSCGVPFVS